MEPRTTADASFRLYDLLGNPVIEDIIPGAVKEWCVSKPMDQLPNGLYFAIVSIEGESAWQQDCFATLITTNRTTHPKKKWMGGIQNEIKENLSWLSESTSGILCLVSLDNWPQNQTENH